MTLFLSLVNFFCFLGHKRDAARAENVLTLSFGSELIGMQRDWNEELQSCREFPHSTDPERCSPFPFVLEYAYKRAISWIFLVYVIFKYSSCKEIKFASKISYTPYLNFLLCRIMRDRALYKVTSDFVDAATNGAIGVINRCIAPINPTDPECFHMLVLTYKICPMLFECSDFHYIFLPCMKPISKYLCKINCSKGSSSDVQNFLYILSFVLTSSTFFFSERIP